MFAVIESRDDEILDVHLEDDLTAAVKTAVALGEESGCSPREVKRSIQENGYHQDGDYRLTVRVAHKS